MEPVSELRARIQRKTANVYDTWFTRRVSIYLTIVVAPWGVSPNQVSIFAAFVGGASCSLIAFGSLPMLLVGVGLLHFYAVLDSVDGELARLTKQFSLSGLFIEDLSAYVMINGFNLAVAWRLYASFQLSWPLWSAVLVAAFARNVMPVARRAILKSVITRRPAKELVLDDHAPSAPSRLKEFLQENVVHATNQWMAVSALLALACYQKLPVQVVAVVFAGTLVLFAGREVGALFVMLRNDRLEQELARVYAAASQSAITDGRQLSTYSAL